MPPKHTKKVVSTAHKILPEIKVDKNKVDKNKVDKNKVDKNKVDIKNNIHGGLKSANDPDVNSDDDYDTDDNTNDEDDGDNGDVDEIVPVVVKENNSDDDLEQKDNTDAEDIESDEPEDEQEVMGDGDDGCIYRFTGKKNKLHNILDDFEAEDDFSDDDDKNIDTTKYADPDKRITKNYMTIYERVRLLGERSKQLSLGAKPMIKGVENLSPKDIAKLELQNKVMPLIIIRTLPNGVKEKWKINELEIIN